MGQGWVISSRGEAGVGQGWVTFGRGGLHVMLLVIRVGLAIVDTSRVNIAH